MCRPDGLTQGDASEGNCQSLLLMGIDVMAGGAAEGAHLQKRLGMCFLSPFPCFHGNSSKQEQPAWNSAAYRSDHPPAQSSRQTLALEGFRPTLTRWIPCLRGELTHACVSWQSKAKRHKPRAATIPVAAENVIPCTLIDSCK